MLYRPSSFRKTAIGVTAAATLFAYPALGQTLKPSPVNAPAQTVSATECAVFGSYVLDEADAFEGKLSSAFLDSVSRFVAAKCATKDAKGEIQIVTMTKQDAISIGTALRRMGKFDIIGISGVKACVRPANGVCSSSTSSVQTLKAGG
jgi:hypothetical protein